MILMNEENLDFMVKQAVKGFNENNIDDVKAIIYHAFRIGKETGQKEMTPEGRAEIRNMRKKSEEFKNNYYEMNLNI